MNSYQNLPSFKITYKDYLRGDNSYVDYPDGGFVTGSIGMNPFFRRGWLTTNPDYSDVSDIASDPEIIANAQGGVNDDLVGLGSVMGGGDGSFYTVDGSTGAYTSVGTDSAHTYSRANSDAVFYDGHYYFTSEEELARTNTDLTSPDYSYWAGTLAQPAFTDTRHPMVVYGNILYIGDGKYIHQIDGVQPQDQVLDLEEGYVIDCMVVYHNLIYISAHQGNGFTKIYTWDGFSPSWLDEYEVNDTIASLFVFEGILFCFYENAVGYFDGTKVVQLREIEGTVYKHMVTKSRTAMYLIENTSTASWITRYSPVVFTGRNRNVWIRYMPELVAAHSYTTCVVSTGQSLFVTALDTGSAKAGRLAGSDANSPSLTETRTFEFNPRMFNSQVKPRMIVAEFDGVSAGQTIHFKYRDDNDVLNDIPNATADGALPENLRRQKWDILKANATRSCAIIVEIEKGAMLKTIDVYYEPTELPVPHS